MNEIRHCAACGAPLSAQVAEDGACPACLVRLALHAEPDDRGAAPGLGAPAGGADRPGRVGPYEIVGVLGEGGMGSVFLAEQREPIRRRIALKIVKRGLDSAAVLRRFEGERQALALMDHPSIARVFDAGETPGGQPYFAMEYVEGESITTYCDRRQSTTRERLQLFAGVCDGIQHAHQKGVIHRDVKPSNVLVAEQDGQPVPKIIDFGIAKAIGHSLTERTLVTDLGVLVGTPEYMSPEQTDPMGLDVDTRTDVYSLGVLLYQLLTGALPLETRDRTEPGLEGLRRRIREETPSRPSARLTTPGGSAGETARLRRADVPTLRRQLAGDLDWITMKALEKDRGRRYGSPAELAADVRRHLANEPVLARPPSALYQLRRFARRNRALVGGIAATVVVLVGGVIVSTVLGLREAQQRRQAEQATRDLEDVAGFQARMLAEIVPKDMGERLMLDIGRRAMDALRKDPAVPRGTTPEALNAILGAVNGTDAAIRVVDEEILARAVASMGREFPDRPLVEARLRETIARSYRQLDLYEKAKEQARRAADLRTQALGRGHPDAIRARAEVATLLWHQGDYAAAEALFLECLGDARRELEDDHYATLYIMNNLALLYWSQKRNKEAVDLLAQTLESARRTLGDDHANVLRTQNNLGMLYWEMHRDEEAETLFRELLDRRRRVLGEEHEDTITSMHNLSLALERQGKTGEARQLAAEAYEKKRKIHGEEHSLTLNSLNNLASLELDSGNVDLAVQLMRKTLQGRRNTLGADHPQTLVTMTRLAEYLQKKGDRMEAGAAFREALEAHRRVLGATHDETVDVTRKMADFLKAEATGEDRRNRP